MSGLVFRRLVALCLVVGLAGCGGGARIAGGGGGLVTSPHYYPPPGPPNDPWGPYVEQASSRFSVPGRWIRAVMRQESGGQQQAVSPVGAIGLMQLMPRTYAELRDENGLGNDPFEPRDNILAGTAYLRSMYERYGAPGFLAAYDAGPGRLDHYLESGESLPTETVNYVAAVAPQLGAGTPMSGPLAAYGMGGTQLAEAQPMPAVGTDGCDADAAYDPRSPCHAIVPDYAPSRSVLASGLASSAVPAPMPMRVAAAARVRPLVPTARSFAAGCDPNAAYDPAHPCHVLEQAAASPAATQNAVASVAREPRGLWGIQVGAFATIALARTQAVRAMREEPDLLGGSAVSLPRTSPVRWGGCCSGRG